MIFFSLRGALLREARLAFETISAPKLVPFLSSWKYAFMSILTDAGAPAPGAVIHVPSLHHAVAIANASVEVNLNQATQSNSE
jgi:hypothetical protein